MKRGVTILLVLASAACLWAASRLHQPLLSLRASGSAAHASRAEPAPPLVTFTTVALGGFRGLVADALWLRAMDLQDEGKFLEIAQLADWITKLEPEVAAIWGYHAWNMAYNISVYFPDPQDRWRWVSNGIRLLRDEGLRYNPGDPLLFRELGWIYQQKIGGRWDDAAPYYRRRLAERMQEMLNGAQPDYARLLAAGSPEAARMRQELSLSPDDMKAIDSKYGPLDWRTPEAQAVYWAFQGLKSAKDDSLDSERMLYQSMAALCRGGRLVFEPDEDVLVTLPEPRLVWNTLKAYEHADATYGIESTRTAHANFLHEAILLLYALDLRKDAVTLYGLMREQFPGVEGSFDDHVRRSMAEWMQGMPQADALGVIQDALFQSFVWEALGDGGRAASLNRFAGNLWQIVDALRRSRGPNQPALSRLGGMRDAARKRALSELPKSLQARVAAGD